ncbi:MAG: hypothetical protein FJZ58_05820, partial [Chlamydiae bacterium]|nr:hypothetical protein [Chlamydiota bacterium]
MNISINHGKIDHSLSQIFNPKDQDERKVCQLAVGLILQGHSGSLEEQVRQFFALGTDALSEKKVQRVVQRVQVLQQEYNKSGLPSADAQLLQDRLQAKSRSLEKLTSLPEGHLLEGVVLIPSSIEMVFSSGIPLTQMGMLEARALLAIASPLYEKRIAEGVSPKQAAEESVEEARQELQSRLLEKLPKCALSGTPIRHPAYINKQEFLDNGKPLTYYESAELERYTLRTHQTPLVFDGVKLPCALNDIRLDGEKQKEIDQVRKDLYQEILQKHPKVLEEPELVLAVKQLEETRDDGIPSSLSLEDKVLLEHHSFIDLAILSLAYPLYQEATSQSSSSSQAAEKAVQKAYEIIKERFEKDPILSRYQDAVSLEVIRDPVEAVL